MKQFLLTLTLALAPLAHADGPTPVPATAPGIQPSPAPTAKPLYVDYTPPDWAKAKTHITTEMAKKMVKDKGVLFCDARSKVEYDQGHIPGAVPLPSNEADKYYAKHLKRIKKAKKLVTYCHGIGCRLSEKSANYLVDKGHKNVAVYFGGWPQWQEHKLPEEKGDTFASDLAEPMVVPAPAAASAPAAVSPAAGHGHGHDHSDPNHKH